MCSNVVSSCGFEATQRSPKIAVKHVVTRHGLKKCESNAKKLISSFFFTSGPIGFFESDFSLEDRRVPQGSVLWADVRREEGYPHVGFFSPTSR